MAVGLVRGDPALVDEGLDEGVVLGDLGQLAVAQEVAAGIADVDQAQPVAGEQDRGERRAHTVEVGILFHLVADRGIPHPNRTVELAEQITARIVVVELGQCGDHQLGGHFAGGVPAHAVGQRQQTRAGVDGVLVIGANQSAITAGGVAKGQCHGRNSITVLPTCTGVPIGTRTAVVTFERSR